MNVWLPYGLKIMHSIDSLLREYSSDSGIEEVSFPVLISREQLEVEFEHVKGFENEIYWVTKGNRKDMQQIHLILHMKYRRMQRHNKALQGMQ